MTEQIQFVNKAARLDNALKKEIEDIGINVDDIPLATQEKRGAMSGEDKTKLDGIVAGATKNATDAQLRDRTTHTGVQPISTVSGLQTALDSKVANTDGRLTDSREWTGSTISQAEAEAGTSTTARKWTAQRVRQSVLAWWAGSADKTKLDSLENYSDNISTLEAEVSSLNDRVLELESQVALLVGE